MVVLWACCRSDDAVNLSANTTPTELDDYGGGMLHDEDAIDILLATQGIAMGGGKSQQQQQQWMNNNAPFVSNIRLCDLDSLVSASVGSLQSCKSSPKRNQRVIGGGGLGSCNSSLASSSFRRAIQLRRHHSYPSVRYFENDEEDEATEEDDFDDEEEDEDSDEEELPEDPVLPQLEGDAVFLDVAESPSRKSIPREIGDNQDGCYFSVASTLDATPRIHSLLLDRLRVRRARPQSFRLLDRDRNDNDDDDETTSVDDPLLVPVPLLQRRHSFPSSTSSSYHPNHPRSNQRSSDEDEEEQTYANTNSNNNEDSVVSWLWLDDPDIPREIGPQQRRRSLLGLRLLKVRQRRRRPPPSLRRTKQFSSQIHAMS